MCFFNYPVIATIVFMFTIESCKQRAVQGAGKSSLLRAILARGRITTFSNIENLLPETDIHEGIAGGLCYCDSAGVNLQVCTHPPKFHFYVLRLNVLLCLFIAFDLGHVICGCLFKLSYSTSFSSHIGFFVYFFPLLYLYKEPI